MHAGLRYLIECRHGIGRAAAVFAEGEDRDTMHAPDAILRPTGVVRGRIHWPDTMSDDGVYKTVYVRELDALESINLLSFREPGDSLNPDGGPARPLSPAISELPHLRMLALSVTPAGGLPRWTGTFPALASLLLVSAELDSIPAWVLERKRLTSLSLAANRLQAVPEALAGLRDLRILLLYGNRLRAIPPILPRMNSLQGVDLRRNRICSASPEEKAWLTRQDSLWLRQRDPLTTTDADTASWEATQDCATP